MSEFGLVNLVALPIGLGLMGFIEPCSIGSSLVVVKFLEGKGAASKVLEVTTFAATRAVFIGCLGVAAVLIGSGFAGFQRAAWIALGLLYAGLGLLYLAGRAGLLATRLGPSLSRFAGSRGSAGLWLLFGLNIPACAAPLLLILLGAAAAGGVAGATLAAGFVSLGLFGLALSLPLMVAVLFAPARRALDLLAGLSKRLPVWTGLILLALGAWSIWLALSPAATKAAV